MKVVVTVIVTTHVAFAALMEIHNFADFERRVLSSDRPVIVGMTAKHCMACRLVMDDLKKIVSQRPAVDLAMVDVLNQALADEVTRRRFSRRIIPNVIGFRAGALVGEAEDHGTRSLTSFVESIQNARMVKPTFPQTPGTTKNV